MSVAQRLPTGDGDRTATVTVYPASPTTAYDKVDDPIGSPDDDTTSIYLTATGRCLFTYPAFSVPAGAAISRVSVFYRHKQTGNGGNNIASALKIGGSYYDTIDPGINTTKNVWNNRTYDYPTNPKTGVAWTADDVNGVGANGLQQFGLYSNDVSPNPYCTAVYIEVAYTQSYSVGLSLASAAGLADNQILGVFQSLSLPGAAAIAESSVLALASALSLTSGTGLAEAPIAALLGGAGLPGAAASSEQAILAALESLGLPVASGISAAALLEILKSIALSGSGALETLSSLIAQGALVLAGNAGLGADGQVGGAAAGGYYWPVNYWPPNYWAADYWPQRPAGAPGQYYESLGLPSLAAIVKSALMEMLGSSAFPGVANISIAGLMQAVGAARIEAAGALTANDILGRFGAAEFRGAAGISWGIGLQAINSVLLSGAAAISPGAITVVLNLLALAVTADLVTSGGFGGSNELALEAAAALATALIYEMGGQLSCTGLASLAPQSWLSGIDSVSLAVSGRMDELARLTFSTVIGLGGTAAQQSAAALGWSGQVSLPALGGLAAAAAGLVQSCSLAGIASLGIDSQLSCAGFLLLESVSAFSPSFGPRVQRGVRLEAILNKGEVNLNLS
jgi:hypothetical protein